MAHQIDQTTGRAAAYFADSPAWHKLGTVIDGARTTEEIRQLVPELFFDVLQIPQTYDWQGEARETGLLANVRSDTGGHLGSVTPTYRVLQNAEAFAILDHALDGLARYESAGSLFDGQRVWVLARLPNDLQIVPGDEARAYGLIYFGHDGETPITIKPVAERVVCWNTLQVALGERTKEIKIRHTAGSFEKAKREARQALGLASQAMDRWQHQAQALARVSLSDTAVKDYFRSVFPPPAPKAKPVAQGPALPFGDGSALLDSILAGQSARVELGRELAIAHQEESDRAAKRHAKLLETLVDNFHNARNALPGIRGSAWAAFNSVTEFVDHERSTRGGSDQQREENHAHSILWGSGAEIKETAWQQAVALAR